MPASHRLGLWQFFLSTAALFLASCAAPLGPGYSVKKQSLEVHYLPGDPPRLEIRAHYQLRNTGNRNLAALEVDLPAEKFYGRTNLRVSLEGGAAATSSETTHEVVRISFGRSWAKKEEHELALEYELTERSAENRGIILSGDSFFLSSTGWFPVLHPPEGLFGEASEREKPLELSVRVPDGFLAHASGKPRGVRKENGELVYRFRIGKEDFDPFVVAGRYFEQRFQNADATILFWTLQAPLPQDQFERAGAHLSASVKVLETNFGPLSKKPQPYRTVQAHSSPYEVLNFFVLSDGNFPRGALYDGELSALEGGPPLRFIEIQLAASWFQQLASPRAEADPVLLWALGQYTVDAVEAEAHGDNTDRQLRIRNAFQDFDARRGKSKEKTLLSLAENDPMQELRAGFLKADLLLDALEDKCGQDNLRHALRHMVQSLRGSTYGYNELRSALEQECHQDLGPMFREWLTETGIPADFRQRYESKP
jgi:hypothetical protein